MNSFKRRLVVTPVLCLAAALTAACARDATPRISGADAAGDSIDATFVVRSPVTLVHAENAATSAFWSIPTENTLTLKACLQDVARLQPIAGQPFTVRTDGGEIRAVSDSAGCLTWTEKVPFNYLRDETYVRSEHWIVGEEGPYRGTRHVPLALNPWMTSGDAVVDLRQGEGTVARLARGEGTAAALLGADQAAGAEGGQLALPTLAIQSRDVRFSGNGASVPMQLVLKPLLSRRALSGAQLTESLRSGEFKLSLVLVERDRTKAGDELAVLAEHEASVTLANEQITVDVPWTLDRKPRATSVLELFFNLEPVAPPVPIEPLAGRAQLAALDGWMLAVVSPLDGAFSDHQRKLVGKLAAKPLEQPLGEEGLACDDGSRHLGFFLNAINVENLGVLSRTANENVPNQVLAGFTVCLMTTDSRKPVTDQAFDAGFDSREAHRVVTDANGCLRFSEAVSFDYFAAEGWVGETLRITSRQAPFENVVREFPVWIDPWAQGEQFFWDCRRGARPAFRTQPARIEMLDYGYTFLGRDLQLDSAMNLTLNRRYQLQLTPRLVRSKGYGGQIGYETVGDGKYHLRVLVLTPTRDDEISRIEHADLTTILKNYKYLSSYEADVQARDGRIVEEVELPVLFQELPVLASRTVMLIQLSPLDRASRLVSRPFYAPWIGASDYGNYGLVQTDFRSAGGSVTGRKAGETSLDLAKLIELGRKSKKTVKKSSSNLDRMIKDFNLTEAGLPRLAQLGFTPAAVKSMTTRARLTAHEAAKLCELVAPTPAALSSCRAAPLSRLEVVRLRHVDTVEDGVDVVDSKYTPMSVSASLSVSHSDVETESAGESKDTNVNVNTSATAKVGTGFNFFGIFKAGAEVGGGVGWRKGKTWYKSKQSADSTATNGASTVSYNRNFAVEELTLSVRAETRRVLVVRLKGTKQDGIVIREPSASSSRTATESYFLISELVGSPAVTLRDPHTSDDLPWMKAIRGRAAFNAVQSVLLSRGKSLVLSSGKVNSAGLEKMDELLDGFARTTPKFSEGAFPSVIY